MKWQRARLLPNSTGTTILDGRLVWVESHKIVADCENVLQGGTVRLAVEQYMTDLLFDGEQASVEAKLAELLPEFSDDVPMIPYEQWLETP